MKKLILGIVIGVSCTALVGAGIENYVVNKNTAEVVSSQNVLVFMDSKPVKEYEYLGTVKMTVAWTGVYSEIKTYLIKTAKKNYPECDAIIIDRGSADVIKFK